MQFRDSPEEATFRTAVRSFIKQNLPKDYVPGDPFSEDPAGPFVREWRGSLAKRGWIAPHWPQEFGGAGMTVTEQFVFNEEMAEARAPQVGGMGVAMIGPILIRFGTEEQQKEHLPRITSGEAHWCQGYSEPGSGSDLASLQTRAVRDGDDYVINGQKIWTSGAHRANWMFALTRTDPDAPKHRGISMLLVDMKSPGVQVRPLITMAGDHVFNEVFFQDVRVPARNLVGEENRGWYIGAALLDFERSNVAGSVALKHTVADLVHYVKETAGREAPGQVTRQVRNELADRAVEAELARLISYRIISMQRQGQIPNYEASMNKLFRTEAMQRTTQTAMRLVGMYGNLYRGAKLAPRDGRWPHSYVAAVSGTIAAGTSEVNRNVIATRGLGLPRS